MMTEGFECWAIVELFGHARIAGKVSEQVIAGHGYLRVDVPVIPKTKYYAEQAAFTRLYGPSAVYSITPVSEEIAVRAAQAMRVEPVNVYIPANPQLAERIIDEDSYDDEDEDSYDDEDEDSYDDEDETD